MIYVIKQVLISIATPQNTRIFIAVKTAKTKECQATDGRNLKKDSYKKLRNSWVSMKDNYYLLKLSAIIILVPLSQEWQSTKWLIIAFLVTQKQDRCWFIFWQCSKSFLSPCWWQICQLISYTYQKYFLIKSLIIFRFISLWKLKVSYGFTGHIFTYWYHAY